jgi:hypothetical protein
MKFKDGTKLGIRCKKYRRAEPHVFGITFHRDKWELFDFDVDNESFATEYYFAIYLFRCEIHIGRIYK